MNTFMNRFFTFRVIIIALIVWVGLCLLIAGSLFLLFPAKVINVVPTAVITVVYAPPTQAPTSNPAAVTTANPTGSTPVSGSIHAGDFVQITGTGGEGLRIRSAPGIENNQLFIANETELFEVKDGPVTAGDYTWWYLVSPKDSSRYGWAAGNFLVLSPKP
jgi:hypothetical protein